MYTFQQCDINDIHTLNLNKLILTYVINYIYILFIYNLCNSTKIIGAYKPKPTISRESVSGNDLLIPQTHCIYNRLPTYIINNCQYGIIKIVLT